MAIEIKLNDVIGRLHDAAKEQANKKIQGFFSRLRGKASEDPEKLLFINTAIKSENGKPSEFIGKAGDTYSIYIARLNIWGGINDMLKYINEYLKWFSGDSSINVSKNDLQDKGRTFQIEWKLASTPKVNSNKNELQNFMNSIKNLVSGSNSKKDKNDDSDNDSNSNSNSSSSNKNADTNISKNINSFNDGLDADTSIEVLEESNVWLKNHPYSKVLNEDNESQNISIEFVKNVNSSNAIKANEKLNKLLKEKIQNKIKKTLKK